MSLLLLFHQPDATATSLSAQHAAWLEGLARVMGLIAPLQVTDSGRSDGVVTQAWTTTAGATTITTSSRPTGAAGPSALTGQQAGWLEKLARAHGLIDPMTVSATSRSDGTMVQTIAQTGGAPAQMTVLVGSTVTAAVAMAW